MGNLDKTAQAGLREVSGLFFRLGLTGFGGPAAVTAMIEDEVVNGRKWVDRQTFLDLVGATNLIPGPNSTELAMHIGHLLCGWKGLVLAGFGFITPAILLSAVFGWFYVEYGQIPAVQPLLSGIQASVIALIVMMALRLTRTGLKTWKLWLICLLSASASVAGLREIPTLFGAALLGTVLLLMAKPLSISRLKAIMPMLVPAVALPVTSAVADAHAQVSFTELGLFFLKIGSILYGSGYVLLAFLQDALVNERGWLSPQQLVDAIAVGQFTPGPLLSTASFIGYVLLGFPGAMLAGFAIFLPSFVFSAFIKPIIRILRGREWTGAFLDAVNASSLGLILAVGGRLGFSAITGWETVLISVLAAVAYIRFRLNAAFLVIGGGLLGFALSALGG